MNTRKIYIVLALLMGGVSATQAQTGLGNQLLDINTVTTAVPFLRITPSAQSGGMGDVGLGVTPNGNCVFQNAAQLSFIEPLTGNLDNHRDFGFNLSYTPWLRSLVNDIYLADINGYYRLDDKQALGSSLRYFSLGEIQFTDANGQSIGTGRPNEFAFDVDYSRKLSKRISIGAGLRYIHSNLASGQTVNGEVVKAGNAASADISFFNRNPVKLGKMKTNLNVGVAITNVGSKIRYSDANVRDFLPANLGVGVGWEFNIDEYNQVNAYLDFNKLLAPTPSDSDVNPADGIPDFRQKSTPAGIFGSFSDAPGGFREEIAEITTGVGVEYWYRQQFGARVGYFYEPTIKGDRKFLTAGLSGRYSVFSLDFSYLIPTTAQRNPLDNTLRFTLGFDFGKSKNKTGGIKPSDKPTE